MILRKTTNTQLKSLVNTHFTQGAIGSDGKTFFSSTGTEVIGFRTKIVGAQLLGNMYIVQTANSEYVFELLPGEFLDTRYLNSSPWKYERQQATNFYLFETDDVRLAGKKATTSRSLIDNHVSLVGPQFTLEENNNMLVLKRENDVVTSIFFTTKSILDNNTIVYCNGTNKYVFKTA